MDNQPFNNKENYSSLVSNIFATFLEYFSYFLMFSRLQYFTRCKDGFEIIEKRGYWKECIDFTHDLVNSLVYIYIYIINII